MIGWIGEIGNAEFNRTGNQDKQSFSLNGYENETNNQTIICHYHFFFIMQLYRGIKETRVSRYYSQFGKT